MANAMRIAGTEAAGIFALFGSSATLLCCALPTAVAALAGTAAIGTLVTAFPWLLVVSRYKAWVFLTGAVLIAVAGALIFVRSEPSACALPTSAACKSAGSLARRLFWTAVSVYIVGGYFAYGRFLLGLL